MGSIKPKFAGGNWDRYKNRQGVKMCVGKKPYDTWDHAQGDARAIKRRKNKGTAVEPYKCRHCGFFHVGNGKAL